MAVFALRIAYGAALVAFPARLTRTWLGEGGQRDSPSVPIRGLGAREVLLHAGGMSAALGGRPVRPWLAASIAGDVADIASTAAARGAVPDGSPLATLAVAGGSALISAAVAVAVEA